MSRPIDQIAQDRRPLHDEDVRHRGVRRRGTAAAARTIPRRWTDMSIAAWPSIEPARPRSACCARLAEQSRPQGQPEQHREDDDHDRTADELGRGELPAHQQREDDAELDDEIRRSDLERHRRGEVGALAKQRAGQRDRGVRARRRRGTQAGGDRQAYADGRRRAAVRSSTAVRRPGRSADSAKPRIRAQRISQVIDPAIRRACKMPFATLSPYPQGVLDRRDPHYVDAPAAVGPRFPGISRHGART